MTALSCSFCSGVWGEASVVKGACAAGRGTHGGDWRGRRKGRPRKDATEAPVKGRLVAAKASRWKGKGPRAKVVKPSGRSDCSCQTGKVTTPPNGRSKGHTAPGA